MRVIVAGSRTFNNYKKLESELEEIIGMLKDGSEVEIVSGGARGADELGRLFAKNKKLKFRLFPAHWNKYGKAAGYKRNVQMGDYADVLVAFWDGKSRGTAHMIQIAHSKELLVNVVEF